MRRYKQKLGMMCRYKQKLDIQKEITSSPMVAVDSPLISATMDAYKRWDTHTTDIEVAFMQSDMVGNVTVKLLAEVRH